MQVWVYLGSIETVKEFVSIVAHFNGDAELKSGKYVIDAKSIMGIFSLDLSKKILLNLNDPTQEELNSIDRFIVKE
ncbi:MAG: HPr family phosphocarrier protein [Lachnospiraceae bacterium]|nr:HPr family phosphocarrier protein [Lachnospiraceae bacterium]